MVNTFSFCEVNTLHSRFNDGDLAACREEENIVILIQKMTGWPGLVNWFGWFNVIFHNGPLLMNPTPIFRKFSLCILSLSFKLHKFDSYSNQWYDVGIPASSCRM
jgi:hypothetical protein